MRGRPEAAEPLTAPTLADLFQRPNGKPTALTHALRAQVKLRNDEGHGAWRRDETELVTLLRHYLLGDLTEADWGRAGMQRPTEPIVALVEGLQFAVAADPWRDLTLAIVTAAATRPLRGWRSIRDHHDQARAHADAERPAPIRLQPADGGAALDLGPYLAGRHCAICGYQDAFFFNGADRDGGRFDLLDYLQGHRQRRPWHQVRDLHGDRRRLSLAAPVPDLAPPTTTSTAASTSAASCACSTASPSSAATCPRPTCAPRWRTCCAAATAACSGSRPRPTAARATWSAAWPRPAPSARGR